MKPQSDMVSRNADGSWQVKTFPGFEGLVFSEGYPRPDGIFARKDVSVSGAWKHLSARGFLLQSVAEAAVFRIASKNEDRSDRGQLTRTTVAYFREDTVWCAAVDDDPNEGLVVTSIEEAVASSHAARNRDDLTGVDHRSFTPSEIGPWNLALYDPRVRSMLRRARENKRVHPLFIPEYGKLATGTTRAQSGSSQSEGGSRFQENCLVQACLGPLAGRYSKTLNDWGYRFSSARPPRLLELEKTCPPGMVQIRLCRLNELIYVHQYFDYNDDYERGGIEPYGMFNWDGHYRGVKSGSSRP